jgi:hypothetical protein
MSVVLNLKYNKQKYKFHVYITSDKKPLMMLRRKVEFRLCDLVGVSRRYANLLCLQQSVNPPDLKKQHFIKFYRLTADDVKCDESNNPSRPSLIVCPR